MRCQYCKTPLSRERARTYLLCPRCVSEEVWRPYPWELKKSEIPKPHNIKLSQTPTTLQIDIKLTHLRVGVVSSLIAGFFWLLALTIFTMFFSPTQEPLEVLIVFLGLFSAAVFSSWVALSSLRPKKSLRVEHVLGEHWGEPYRATNASQENLRIRIKQTQILSKRATLSCHGLQQIYCAPRGLGAIDGHQHFCFDLMGLYGDGSRVVLLSDFSDPQSVRFIEAQLERALSIEDGPAPGEFEYPEPTG